MAVNILLKRSATASKRPVGASMAFGELNLNYDAATGGLYYKDSAGTVVKVGPCQFSATAPNSTPGAGGSAGNSTGEFWFDTATQTLKLYNGTSWVEAGGSVQGVTGTAPITVDNLDPLNPIVGINAASTTAPGAVQLNDTTSSFSDTEALTANQGRILQEQINDLVITSNLTFAGTLNTTTGNLLTVTAAGISAGFVAGSPLPAAAPGNAECFVIVEVASSSYTPPGGSATETHIGDWFLSDGAAWQFLNVGFQAPYASTTTPGVVQLATDAEVQAGTNTDHAVTPSGLQSKVSDSTSTNSSTTIASSAAVKSAFDTAISANDLATSAFDAAGLAQADADQALLDAAAAQSDATQALSDAAAAQATADQAVLDAAAAQSDATQALSDAAAAQATADAAMPKAGGTFTGNVIIDDGVTLDVETAATLDMKGQANFTGTSYFIAPSSTTFEVGSTVVYQTTPTFESSLTIGGTGTSYTFPSDDGAANYILATDGAGNVSWVANSPDGVAGVTGDSPITVDNSDPANPVVGIDAASTTAPGAVQLNDTVTSTSVTEAATANAVKIAYDVAVAAAAAGNVSGITSDTVIFVNSTDGNDTTGQRGTTKAFRTITAALAAAQESDTIFLSPGSFTENVTMNKGVNMVGTMNDQALTAGTRVVGNFSVGITGAGTRNWAISHVYFISTNSTAPFTVTNNSFGAGGIGTVNYCTFTQQTGSDPTQYAVVTTGTWTRSLYFRECTFDGNFHHNAGTAAGASGYVVIDRLLGVGNSGFYNRVTTGTAEFRNPSNSLAAVFQTGGVTLINGAAAGITPSGAGLNSVFGSAGFSYKGSAAAAGAGTVYFSGECQGTGKVEIGANLIYGYTGLIMDPANLTINVAAIPYTTAVPAAANAQTLSQQRPRLDLLRSTSSVSAANQLATVVDASTGAVYSVTAMDAGTY